MVMMAAVTSIALAACDMNTRAPSAMTIQLSEQRVNVATCETGTIIVQTVLFNSDVSAEGSRTPVAVVDPQLELDTAQSLDLATLIFDRSVDFELRPGAEIYLALYARTDRSGDRIEGVFEIPQSGLPDGRWLHEDGSTTVSPCADR